MNETNQQVTAVRAAMEKATTISKDGVWQPARGMLVQELHRASPGDVIGFVRAAPLALHVLLGDDTSEVWKLHVIGVGYLMTIALATGNGSTFFQYL